MRKLCLLFALPLLFVAGCRRTRGDEIQFVLTPSADGGSVTVECKKSTTDKCHFAFAGSATPAEAIVYVGDQRVIQGVTVGTEFCGEPHRVSIDSCSRSPILQHRNTVTKRRSSDNDAD